MAHIQAQAPWLDLCGPARYSPLKGKGLVPLPACEAANTLQKAQPRRQPPVWALLGAEWPHPVTSMSSCPLGELHPRIARKHCPGRLLCSETKKTEQTHKLQLPEGEEIRAAVMPPLASICSRAPGPPARARGRGPAMCPQPGTAELGAFPRTRACKAAGRTARPRAYHALGCT